MTYFKRSKFLVFGVVTTTSAVVAAIVRHLIRKRRLSLTEQENKARSRGPSSCTTDSEGQVPKQQNEKRARSLSGSTNEGQEPASPCSSSSNPAEFRSNEQHSPCSIGGISEEQMDDPERMKEQMGAVFGPIIVHFRKNLQEGDEIMTHSFLESAAATLGFIDALGSIASVMPRRDFKGNMAKAQTWLDVDPERHKTLRSFLENEKATGIHKVGGVLAEHSGAMGVLWIRRNFEFFQRLAVNLESDPDGTAVEISLRSYEESFAKYHGWYVRLGFQYVFKLVPTKRIFLNSLNVHPDPDVHNPILRAFASTAESLIVKLKALQEELDLEDPTIV